MNKVSEFMNVKIPLGSSNVIKTAKELYKKIGEEKMKNLVK
jgi:ribonuclease HIII